MNRRRFLAASLAAVAPLFVADAFAAGLGSALGDLDALSEAFGRARAAGRPLFVIVIPAEESDLWDRGRRWGEVLMYGGQDVMAALGQVEVVCAHDAAVRAFAPRAAGSEPWLWVIPTDAMEGEPIPGTPEPVEHLTNTVMEELEWEAARARELEVETTNTDRDIAALSDAIEAAVGEVTGGAPRGSRAALAARAEKALREGVPANTHWANAGGCGTTVEGVESNVSFGCGMGFVPARSRRFLYFYDIEEYKRRGF